MHLKLINHLILLHKSPLKAFQTDIVHHAKSLLKRTNSITIRFSDRQFVKKKILMDYMLENSVTTKFSDGKIAFGKKYGKHISDKI